MADKIINRDISTYEDDNIPVGMLSSPQIEYCVDKFGIIKNFKKEHLGSSTYNMRIGGPVLAWDRENRIEFTLEEQEDRNRSKYKSIELKPNSLTFVTTIEEFRLTKDIIARFNLKSVLVHQGLLLGTGPIVDPQLHARLLIPIHNFSNKSINLNYGDEFISVEFTKTANPEKAIELSNGNYATYINNKSWDYNFEKYRKRIGDKEVASSVRSQFQAYGDTIKFYQNEIEQITKKNEEQIGIFNKEKKELFYRNLKFNLIGLLAVIAAIAALFFMSWDVMNNANDKADAAYKFIQEYKNNSLDFRSLALKKDLDEIGKNFNEFKGKMTQLNIESHSELKESYSDLIELLDRLEKRIDTIDLRINDLNSAIKQNVTIKDK